jgi:predicted dehydrogenase
MNKLPRRRFLGVSAGLAGTLALGLHSRAQGSAGRIRLAIIGLGGRGIGLAQMLARRPDVEIAWLCDPDQRRWARSVAAFDPPLPRAPNTAADFRRALEDPSVAAVVVATPDHWHGLATILACQAGKDVYVEKPLAHNVREGRAMIAAARKHNRIVQVGTQSRSAAYARAAKDYLASGKLGDVHLVRVFNLMEHPLAPLGAPGPAPAGFDYDLWCGPAAKLPYHPDRRWLNFAEYSCGPIAGDAVHQLDLARFVLGDPPPPRSVACQGGIYALRDGRDTADTQTAVFDYGSYTLLSENALWTPYMKKTEMAARDTDEFPDWTFCATKIEILGTRGFMYLGRHGDGWQVFDANHERIVAEPGKQADREHLGDFLDAVRSRRLPAADVAIGHASTLLSHLANASWRAGNVTLRFDAATESFPDTPSANALLGRTYRPPWSLPSA